MMLILLLFTLFISAFIGSLGPKNVMVKKSISTIGLGVALLLTFMITNSPSDTLLTEWRASWIPAWGIEFHFGLDMLSWWLVILTLVVGIIATLFTTEPPQETSHASILWTVFALVGLFSALDTFLFFIFWELSLLPMYWVILSRCKDENRKGALKYIVYTQLSGLLLLCSIIGCVISHYRVTGTLTFDYEQLRQSAQFFDMQSYLFFGFLAAFLLKLPSIPFHGWLISIFTQAPASMVMIAVLVKTSIFGLLRFAWPFFPECSLEYALPIMIVGVCSLLYGAVLAFSQKEPRRFIAYSTLSHAGLLLIGVFAGNLSSSLGVVLLMICQALSTGGILLLVSTLAIKDLSFNHGLWNKQPVCAVILLMLLLAGFGFPGSGNFLGEWLLLFGTFVNYPILALWVGLGMILSAVYSLWFFQKLCWGNSQNDTVTPTSLSQHFVLAGAVIMLLSIGFFPRMIIAPLETLGAHQRYDVRAASVTSSVKGIAP